MDRLGDRFDLKEFHRVVLSNGSMPLEVLDRVVQDYIDAELASVRSLAGSVCSSPAWRCPGLGLRRRRAGDDGRRSG